MNVIRLDVKIEQEWLTVFMNHLKLSTLNISIRFFEQNKFCKDEEMFHLQVDT